MRYAIFSDVHGNLEAFGEALNFYRNQNIDKFICLGDTVGYGANPNECLNLLKGLNSEKIAGNHDWATIGKFNINYFNRQAKEAIIWTREKVNKENKRFLENLSLKYQEKNFCCVHGSLDKPGKFNYTISAQQAHINFSRLNKQICFIGHSHLAETFSLEKGEIRLTRHKQLKVEKNKKYIVNVGSVGQPRDGDPRLSLCAYDTKKKLLEFQRIPYNIEAAAGKIIKSGLPVFLAQRLYVGI